MKARLAIFLTLTTLLLASMLKAQGEPGAPLRFVQSIPLPNVEGYLDHMAVDIKGQRLFLPAEAQHTVEVIDLRAGKVIHTITGFNTPHKIVYLPQPNEIFVDDEDGTCRVFNGESYELVKTIQLSDTGENHGSG